VKANSGKGGKPHAPWRKPPLKPKKGHRSAKERMEKTVERAIHTKDKDQKRLNVDDHVRNQKSGEMDPPEEQQAKEQRRPEMKGRERHRALS